MTELSTPSHGAPGVAIPGAWRRAGRVLDPTDAWGSVVMGDPCVVRDEAEQCWRMFVFALPPGHGHATCSGDPADPAQWTFRGPLQFTNPETLGTGGAFKPFLVCDAHRPGHAACIGGRYALLFVSSPEAKVVRRAWSASLGGPWTVEPRVLIERGGAGDFDGRHVDAVSGYFFPEREEILYFYMGYPNEPQPHPSSPLGSAQGAAVEHFGDVVRKLGPILLPATAPRHWAAGWVGGLQLLPGSRTRWIGVVNASPTPPDHTDTSMAAEEPPPSLGGFAWCNSPWPVTDWHWCEQPIERIDAIPPLAVASGEGVNLWRHYALPLGDNRLALFYNSGPYFEEKLFLKISETSPAAATDRRIEAVLFDFGGVFTESPFEAAREVGRELGVDPALMLETVFGPYDEDTNHPWHRLERGEITLTEAREGILALGESHGFESDLFRVLALLSRTSGPRSEMVARVRALRSAGLRTAIVTNNAREFREAWRALLPLEELFDVVVDSCEVSFRKPDPRIFRHTLELLGGIAPESAMLLDDYAGNVRAAELLGMEGVLVGNDPSSALAVLDELLLTR